MGASPIFQSSPDAMGGRPIFPDTNVATGMANVPASTAGIATGLGAAANSMQAYRDQAIGQLARLHALIDAGQLPQSALSDPAVQPLFHQAGLDIESHLALLPKPQDQITQLTSDELALPRNQAGTPAAAMITKLPSEEAGNVQGAADVATRTPEVAQVQSKVPTAVQAKNTLKSGDIGSETGVVEAGIGGKKASVDTKVWDNITKRYKDPKKPDPVFDNFMEQSRAGTTPLLVEEMKQVFASAGLNKQLAANGGAYFASALGSTQKTFDDEHDSWMKSRQAEENGFANKQILDDSHTDDEKAALLAQHMSQWDARVPQPTYKEVYERNLATAASAMGATPEELAIIAAKLHGAPDAGTLVSDRPKLIGNIIGQLRLKKVATIKVGNKTITGTLQDIENAPPEVLTPQEKDFILKSVQGGLNTRVGAPAGQAGGGSRPVAPRGTP